MSRVRYSSFLLDAAPTLILYLSYRSQRGTINYFHRIRMHDPRWDLKVGADLWSSRSRETLRNPEVKNQSTIELSVHGRRIYIHERYHYVVDVTSRSRPHVTFFIFAGLRRPLSAVLAAGRSCALSDCTISRRKMGERYPPIRELVKIAEIY